VDLAYEYRWKFLCMAENVKVLKKAIEWLSNGKGVSLAVVVGTWGSSPRPAGSLLRENRGQMMAGERRLFVAVYNLPLRIVIVGAVHVAQTLAPMAVLAGFDVMVIDPRHSFATEARFPGLALLNDWPDDAMAKIGLNSSSAVVTLTHDPKLDDPALVAALRSDSFYVGALGSRRTHAKRIDRLKESGLDDAAILRIHSPIGLPLGGRNAPEIAVSILAEIIGSCYGADVSRKN
jgi:xanthine dehydrogenase accessory factor